MSGWYKSGSLLVRTTMISLLEMVPPRSVILQVSLQMLFVPACINCVLCFPAWYSCQCNASQVVHPLNPRVILKVSQITTGSSDAQTICMTWEDTHSVISTCAFSHPSSHLLNSSFSIFISHSPIFCTYSHSPSCTRSCCIRNSNMSQLSCVSLLNWYLGSPLLLAIIVCHYGSSIQSSAYAGHCVSLAHLHWMWLPISAPSMDNFNAPSAGGFQCTLPKQLLMCPWWTTSDVPLMSNFQCALNRQLPMCPCWVASDVPSASNFQYEQEQVEIWFNDLD